MAKKRRTKREERPRAKVTFIFFHGDAMDLIDAIEEKLKESGPAMETIARVARAAGIPVPMSDKPPPPAKPN